eukprot:Gb_21017 [translate_table: standard]
MLENACYKGCHIDLQEVFMRFIINSVFIVGFRADLMSFTMDLDEVPFLMTFKYADRSCIRRWLNLAFVWNTLRFSIRMEGQLREAQRMIDKCIALIVATTGSKNKNGVLRIIEGPLDMLSIHLQLDHNGCSMVYNDGYIRGYCVSIILLAMDTMPTTLTCFFWLLQLHLEVEHKLMVELHIKEKRVTCIGDPLSFSTD